MTKLITSVLGLDSTIYSDTTDFVSGGGLRSGTGGSKATVAVKTGKPLAVFTAQLQQRVAGSAWATISVLNERKNFVQFDYSISAQYRVKLVFGNNINVYMGG